MLPDALGYPEDNFSSKASPLFFGAISNRKSEIENRIGLPSRSLGETGYDSRNEARLRFTPAWQPSLCASLQAKPPVRLGPGGGGWDY